MYLLNNSYAVDVGGRGKIYGWWQNENFIYLVSNSYTIGVNRQKEGEEEKYMDDN